MEFKGHYILSFLYFIIRHHSERKMDRKLEVEGKASKSRSSVVAETFQFHNDFRLFCERQMLVIIWALVLDMKGMLLASLTAQPTRSREKFKLSICFIDLDYMPSIFVNMPPFPI